MDLKRIGILKYGISEIRIDRSWGIVAVFSTLTLATGVFPYYYKHLPRLAYWWMGGAATVGLFFSVLFHELSHLFIGHFSTVLIANSRLYLFGGIAESESESLSLRDEIAFSLAGPAANFILFLLFHMFLIMGKESAAPLEVLGVLDFLSMVNITIAVFNLLPAYPLDGGRVVKKILRMYNYPSRKASSISSKMGSVFGLLLILIGIMLMVRGVFIGGIWWILIGSFLQSAALYSHKKFKIRESLEGEMVSRVMTENPVIISPSLSITRFVHDYLYRYHFKLFPVVANGGRLLGGLNAAAVFKIPKEEWDCYTIAQLLNDQAFPQNYVLEETETIKVFAEMYRTGQSRMIVVDGSGMLVGIVVLKDILSFLSGRLLLR